MSGVKHTPGPWSERFGDVYAPSGQVIPHWGDSWESPDRFVAEAEREANARLIAAAPCMFEYIALQAKSGDYAAVKLLERIGGS